jgi:hypothetical protein
MKLPGCATRYMTRIIAQQTAELDHVNIFNIANFSGYTATVPLVVHCSQAMDIRQDMDFLLSQ